MSASCGASVGAAAPGAFQHDLCAAATDGDGAIDFSCPQLKLLRAIVASVLATETLPATASAGIADRLGIWVVIPHSQALVKEELHRVAIVMWLVWCAAAPRVGAIAQRMRRSWQAALQAVGWELQGGGAGALAHAASGCAAVKAWSCDVAQQRLSAVLAVALRDVVWGGMRLAPPHHVPACCRRLGRRAMLLHRQQSRGAAVERPQIRV